MFFIMGIGFVTILVIMLGIATYVLFQFLPQIIFFSLIVKLLGNTGVTICAILLAALLIWSLLKKHIINIFEETSILLKNSAASQLKTKATSFSMMLVVFFLPISLGAGILEAINDSSLMSSEITRLLVPTAVYTGAVSLIASLIFFPLYAPLHYKKNTLIKGCSFFFGSLLIPLLWASIIEFTDSWEEATLFITAHDEMFYFLFLCLICSFVKGVAVFAQH